MHRSSNPPLQDDIGVSVCVCMFVKDKDGGPERGSRDLETKDPQLLEKSLLQDACPRGFECGQYGKR